MFNKILVLFVSLFLPLMATDVEHIAVVKVCNNSAYTVTINFYEPMQKFLSIKPGESEYFRMVVTPNDEGRAIYWGGVSTTQNPSGFSYFDYSVLVDKTDLNMLVLTADASVKEIYGKRVPQPWVEGSFGELSEAPEFTEEPQRLHQAILKIVNDSPFRATFSLWFPVRKEIILETGKSETFELWVSPKESDVVVFDGRFLVYEGDNMIHSDFVYRAKMEDINSKILFGTFSLNGRKGVTVWTPIDF